MKILKRVTIQDIANEANVSYATVSKVLSGKTGGNIRVSEKTREKILKVSSSLGYVPNHMARNLKSNNLSLISVFTYENMSDIEIQREYYDFYTGVYLQGEKNGLDVLLLNTRKNISSSSRVTLSSGAVMIGVERDDSDISALLRRNFPLVFVGRREINGLETNWVGFDYKGIIFNIVKILSENNVKKVLFINSCNKAEPYTDKSNYLINFAKEFNIEVDIMNLSKDELLSQEHKELLSSHSHYLVDRIWQTPLIESYLNDNSLILGKDKFGILMEDDWLNKNNWTCWTKKRKELGALAVDFLFAILNNKELPKENLVPLEIVFNESFR